MRNAENGTVRTESKNLVDRGKARDPSTLSTTVLAKSGTHFSFRPLRMTAWGTAPFVILGGMTGEKCNNRSVNDFISASLYFIQHEVYQLRTPDF